MRGARICPMLVWEGGEGGRVWRGRTSRLFRGRGESVDREVWVRQRLCQIFQLRHPPMRETMPPSFSSSIRMTTLRNATPGPCPPCTIEITRPCRCGGTTRSLPCHQIHTSGPTAEESEILCDRPCTVLRACGRHQCRRVCCPPASLASTSGKKARNALGQGREMGMGMGLGKSPRGCTSVT